MIDYMLDELQGLLLKQNGQKNNDITTRNDDVKRRHPIFKTIFLAESFDYKLLYIEKYLDL